MVDINLDVFEDIQESCSLDNTCMMERIKELKEGLFSKAESVKELEKKIILIFVYSKEVYDEIGDFINFENNCCGNFTLTLKVEMRKQLLTVDIDM